MSNNEERKIGALDQLALGLLDGVVRQDCGPVVQALYSRFRPGIKQVLERDLRFQAIEELPR